MIGRLTACALASLVFVGCAAGPQSTAPSARPPATQPLPGSETTTTTTTTSTTSMPSKAEVMTELDRSYSEFTAAGTDCTLLCKALASMSRAADQICALTEAEPDDPRCKDAREKVMGATMKVKSTCGGCSGG